MLSVRLPGLVVTATRQGIERTSREGRETAIIGWWRTVYDNVIFCHMIMCMSQTKTRRVTISLPAEMLEAADRQARLELRDRSELVREALRHYLARIPLDDATPEEMAAIERGRVQHTRGEFVTLGEMLHELEADRRPRRAKGAHAAAE
jgi:predicted transcriptional regulator